MIDGDETDDHDSESTGVIDGDHDSEKTGVIDGDECTEMVTNKKPKDH